MAIQFAFIIGLFFSSMMCTAIPINAWVVNIMETPAGILPEWYLVIFFSVIKAVPDKGPGLVILIYAIVIMALPCIQMIGTTLLKSSSEYCVPIMPLYVLLGIYTGTCYNFASIAVVTRVAVLILLIGL